MKYLLAVSGGIDSMVLLDIYSKNHKNQIIVAHFNHKLRPSSDDDEKFIKKICKENNIRCEIGYLKSNKPVTEEIARKKRYEFLNKIENESKEPVIICTAHHLDDLTETVAINLLRGTSWRGLTPFSSDVFRPFIQEEDVLKPESKADILTYASRNKLTFRQDPTNYEPTYLRNRIREKLSTLDPEEKYQLNQKIKNLYKKQVKIKSEIEKIFSEFLKDEEQGIIKREWFKNLDEKVALELLRHLLSLKNLSLTGPKLKDFLNAIKTYKPEKKFNLPEDKLVTIHKTYLKI